MESDRKALRSIALGYRLSLVLYVFAELGLADLMADAAGEVGDLAEEARCDPDHLRRILRVARALDLVCELPGDAFELTPRGRLLIRDGEGSVRSRLLAVGDRWQWDAWGSLLETVRTGDSAFEREHGANSFEFFDRNPGAGEKMMNRVTDEARHRGGAICEVFDFASVRCLVDVGGGRGAVLAEIMSRHDNLRGVLLDLPYAVADAADVLGGYGVADRCEVVAADFRGHLSAEGDACLLSAVLHSWNDEDSVALLRRCLDRYGRVIVVDEAADPAGASLGALLKDLQLMVFSGGRLRDVEQYRVLFERAGGRMERAEPIGGDEFLMVGTGIRQ